ncbi:HEAT repeat domain-containing protein [Domibacillus indicus]|uniref:HEAT repeat domain-containing protein n=1 Tax=Domibacillus indicus TaxID=1437523 RepID=UPI00203CFD52|nr:HEAT repeat domain-containing protein [Domibacillus indicus]MCM3789127.1 HEAT repeat domain-containing protein [Domibacillus indicus]
MNKDQALLGLKKYSPMPDEEGMTEEMLDEYADAINYFIEHPDPICITPIMMTFSLSESYGIYDHAVAVLESFSSDQIVPQLIEIIQSENEGKRYWGTQIAKSFPDERLVDSLLSCINDPNEEIRAYSIYALHYIGNKKVLPMLQERLDIEEDEEVLEELKEAISSFI